MARDGALFVAVSEFHGVFSIALDFVTQILSLVWECHSLFKLGQYSVIVGSFGTELGQYDTVVGSFGLCSKDRSVMWRRRLCVYS